MPKIMRKVFMDSDREVARLRAELARERERGGWQPIETAPKDGTEVLVILREDLPEHCEHLNGRALVMRHWGVHEDGFDPGWSFPGFGGIPDRWAAGWMPLPAAPERQEVG